MIETLKKLYDRDLRRLHEEISSYRNEDRLWIIDGHIANSGGNLCLHLMGNLRTYIGRELGGTPYVRDRDAEFALKGVPRAQLLSGIEETRMIVLAALDKLRGTDLQKEFPMLVFENMTSIEYMLIHLATHLGYHLGQINYHRRMLDQIDG